VVGVIVITVAACSLTGSNSQSGPDMLSIGDHTIIGEGNSTTAGLMVSDLTVSTQPDDQSSNTPVHGYFVTVTATAVVGQDSTNGFDIGPLDFYAEVNGTHYGEGNGNAEYAISDPSMELSETILGAGEKTSGELLFDLPSRHGYIVYAPNANGQPLAEWKY